MEYQTEIQNSFIDELTKSKIDVCFSGESYNHGTPFWWPDLADIVDEDDYSINKGKYSIEIDKPTEQSIFITKIFKPYSISINNMFESPLEFPFFADEKYSPYFKSLTERLIIEIDQNVKQRIGIWSILDYLANLRLELKEIRKNYSKQKDIHIHAYVAPIYLNQNVEFNIINNDDPSPYEWKYVDCTLTQYWIVQVNNLELIIKKLNTHIKNIKESDDYVLEASKLAQSNQLVWTKSDTDLLELITALYEHGALQNSTKDLTHKDAIASVSNLFGKEIKDQYKKLNAARARKKDEAPAFLSKVQDSLEAYYERQDSKAR